MRIIGLEEHFWTPEIAAALRNLPPEQQDDGIASQSADINQQLEDLGDERLRRMDLAGLDLMVLSVTTPGTQLLPPAQAVPLARQANDRLAAAIQAHPDRLAGWATLPTPDPAAAAAELQRAVQELGLKGAMLHGRTGLRYLDHPEYEPLLAMAAQLRVPLYIHPQLPARPVRAVYYDGFDPALSAVFAGSGWGWHLEAGITALRLILAGTFDRLPGLQVVLGHWGETVALFLERADRMTAFAPALQRPVADYFRHHFHLTGSGIYSTRYLQQAIEVVGIDRIMYSTDYPFQFHPDGTARHFLEQAPLPFEDKAKIGHLNAERLLRL